MSDKLSKVVLGSLRMRPNFLEIAEFDESLFSTEREKKVFQIISDLWENGRPEEIDAVLLAERLGGDGAITFVSSLTDGLQRLSPEMFLGRVRELKRQVISGRLASKLKKELDLVLKTGAAPDLSAIRAGFEELDWLENPAEQPKEAAMTIEELNILQIPKIDWLVEPIIERFGFCLIGAQKGVGKSLLVSQLALYAASGASPFLIDDLKIANPLKVLLIQQEVSLPGMKDRLFKMQREKVFDLGGRFFQKTTTGAWWNLTDEADYKKLIQLIEKYKPDILILDPLYTFYPKELNTSGDISPMMKILSDLKSNFGLGLVVVHHFSNKTDSDEIEQRSSVSRFMGHSMIANSADTTIGLDFLHYKYRQQTLPLPYQNYALVEITTRHGVWPARFVIERKDGCLLFEKSSLWQDLGRSIIPGQIEEILKDNDGEMLQKDLILALSGEAGRTTIRRAIDDAIARGVIQKDHQTGKGSPAILRLK
jgi:hypothetical protein